MRELWAWLGLDSKKMITQEFANKLINYDPETGLLTRKVRTSNAVQISDIAGTFDKDGYVQLGVAGRVYKAHRLIWLMYFGKWPADEIDHINGIKADNRIVNLRAVSRSENSKNIKLRPDNRSGICGIYWSKSERKWKAQIIINKRHVYLGGGLDLFELACLRKSAEIKHGFHADHGVKK